MIASSLWDKGEYTDDTQMALLIAESVLENKGFVAADVATRFQKWARTAKDVGIQTRAVVDMAGYAENPEGCASRYYTNYPDSSAGNGALMRCAPVALEAAAWCFLTTDCFEDAVVRAANLSDDADTVAAVCGALAGAFYGYAAIPRRWRDQLQDENQIREIALALARCAEESL